MEWAAGFLALVVIAILVYHDRAEKRWARERRDLMDTIVAKNVGELRTLRAEPVPPREPVPVLEGYEGQVGL